MAEQTTPNDLNNSDSSRVREWRSELLASADAHTLITLAQRCLESGDTRPVSEPTVGMVPVSVREPVVGERFILVDVLAARAEVDHRGERGWAICVGDNKEATVAAAICDAEAAANGPLTGDIDELCQTTERMIAERDAAEWAELLPTEVRFEELVK